MKKTPGYSAVLVFAAMMCFTPAAAEVDLDKVWLEKSAAVEKGLLQLSTCYQLPTPPKNRSLDVWKTYFNESGTFCWEQYIILLSSLFSNETEYSLVWFSAQLGYLVTSGSKVLDAPQDYLQRGISSNVTTKWHDRMVAIHRIVGDDSIAEYSPLDVALHARSNLSFIVEAAKTAGVLPEIYFLRAARLEFQLTRQYLLSKASLTTYVYSGWEWVFNTEDEIGFFGAQDNKHPIHSTGYMLDHRLARFGSRYLVGHNDISDRHHADLSHLPDNQLQTDRIFPPEMALHARTTAADTQHLQNLRDGKPLYRYCVPNDPSSTWSPPKVTKEMLHRNGRAEGCSTAEFLFTGQPGGKTILLIPGVPGSIYDFHRVIPLLAARGYNVLAITPPGKGFAALLDTKEFKKSPFTYYGKFWQRVFADFKLQDVYVVAFSAGFAEFSEAVVNSPHPLPVAGVMAIGPWAPLFNSRAIAKAEDAHFTRWYGPFAQEIGRDVGLICDEYAKLFRKLEEDEYEPIIDRMLSMHWHINNQPLILTTAAQYTINDQLENYQALHRRNLHKFAFPFSLVVGDHETVIRHEGEKYGVGYARAVVDYFDGNNIKPSLTVLENSDHLIPLEDSVELAGLIDSFIKSVER